MLGHYKPVCPVIMFLTTYWKISKPKGSTSCAFAVLLLILHISAYNTKCFDVVKLTWAWFCSPPNDREQKGTIYCMVCEEYFRQSVYKE
jgi:hypothetical protein